MAQVIMVEFYIQDTKVDKIEMTWNWKQDLFPKDLEFEEIEFAGEIDQHAEISKQKLQEIHQFQTMNYSPSLSFGHVGYRNKQKLEEILNGTSEFDKIKIVLYEWSSGY